MRQNTNLSSRSNSALFCTNFRRFSAFIRDKLTAMLRANRRAKVVASILSDAKLRVARNELRKNRY